MIWGLPASTFWAFFPWPIIWLALAAYFWIRLDKEDKLEQELERRNGQ